MNTITQLHFIPMNVYTDGACSNNGAADAPAGIGVWSTDIEISKRLPGKQTNNSAELEAVRAALEHIGAEAGTIHTDSTYVLTMCDPDRVEKREEYPNKPLILKLRSKLAETPSVRLCHVPAHSGKQDEHSIGNAHADRLAQLGCKEPRRVKWNMTSDKSLLYLAPAQPSAASKVAAFDIDWTIIRPKSGKVFPTCARTDWEFWAPEVKPALQRLSSLGYRIVFFSNQGKAGFLSSWDDWAFKISTVIDALELTGEVTVLAATTRTSSYRKPQSSMWSFLTNQLSTVPADLQRSFYCGDAAGRAKTATKKKDFSASDLKFALNIGLKFHTPEAFFLPTTLVPPSRPGADLGFQPREHWDAEYPYEGISLTPLIAQKQEVLVITGSPGSGKSSLAARIVGATPGRGPLEFTLGNTKVQSQWRPALCYVCANQDTLKTKAKCVKAVRVALQSGLSVVIDNTNRNASARAPYVAEAKAAGVGCRAIWLKTTKEEVFHLNALREARVPDVAIHTYFKNMSPPTMSEGFSDVIDINFVPRFETPEDKAKFFEFAV